MKCMLKKMGLLVILFTITFSVSASVYSNYDKAVKNTDTFITKFDKYKLYLETTNMYLYNGKLSAKAGFNNGGFISTYEFNTTISNKDSYLITGSRYFTMTDSSDMVDVVNLRKITNENKNNTFESRVTEYIIPETKITGSGSRNDPWVFKMPKYKITINLSNAAIDESNNFVDTIYGYNATYLISPDTFYHFKNNDGDLSCSGEANVVLANDKISFKNVSSDVTCNVKYRGDIVTASIIVNNGTAANSTLSGEVGKDLSTTITATTGYAFSNVSCTNSQNATYASKTITINKISNYTTCTLDYVKVPTVNPTGDGTYTVPTTGYYLLTALGAQGSGNGGKGGSVSAEVYLIKGQSIIYSQGTTTNGAASVGNGSSAGGGSSTFKLNNSYFLIGAGGGGGSNGTAGGNGTGQGGVNTSDSSKNGKNGVNGCGGSSAQNITTCSLYGTCGGGCTSWSETSYRCCESYESSQTCATGQTDCGDVFCDDGYTTGSTGWKNCMKNCGAAGTGTTCKTTGTTCTSYTTCEDTTCSAYAPTYSCCKSESTVSGNPGNGGKNSISSTLNGKSTTVKTNATGSNSSNGSLKITFVKEG